MLRKYVILIVLTASLISSAAFAQNATVPRYSVIPVTMASQLSSSIANPGDTFTAVSNGSKTCCFPVGTTFFGVVTKVIRASGRMPGQIAVHFKQAKLPDGTGVAINGALTSIDDNNVCPDANGMCTVAKSDARDARDSFIAGNNCTVYIGVLCRGNIIIGEGVNVASLCPPVGAIRAAAGRDVAVTCGTPFGIMLKEPVCIPQSACNPAACPPGACPLAVCATAPSGAGPGGAVAISFASAQPFTANGIPMVPLKAVMDATGTSYTVDPNSNMLTFTTSQGTVTHKLGTNIISINGQEKQLNAYSGTMGSVIYVPADAIGVATGRVVTWDATKSMLRIQ